MRRHRLPTARGGRPPPRQSGPPPAGGARAAPPPPGAGRGCPGGVKRIAESGTLADGVEVPAWTCSLVILIESCPVSGGGSAEAIVAMLTIGPGPGAGGAAGGADG